MNPRSRKRPAEGVCPSIHRPTIALVTVCTGHREPWLADPEVHELLTRIWTTSVAWRVGRYVLLPDHLHLFARPGEPEVPIERWVRYWKNRFRALSPCRNRRFQDGCWHHRLRHFESYLDRWEYVRHNPVRHGLVLRPDLWPFQGELFDLGWD